jgi:hypothetical protein
VHSSILLEALDRDLDTLDEGLVRVVHQLFLSSLFRLHRWLNVCGLESRWLQHVLASAFGVHRLLLRQLLDWEYGRFARTWIESDICIRLEVVRVEGAFTLERNLALDCLAIRGNLKECALAKSCDDKATGLIASHLLEATDATDRDWLILSATAALQKIEITREILVGEVEVYLYIVSKMALRVLHGELT